MFRNTELRSKVTGSFACQICNRTRTPCIQTRVPRICYICVQNNDREGLCNVTDRLLITDGRTTNAKVRKRRARGAE